MQPDGACSKGLLRDALCAGGAGSTSDLDGLVNFRASEVSPFPHPLLSLLHFHRLLISLSLSFFARVAFAAQPWLVTLLTGVLAPLPSH